MNNEPIVKFLQAKKMVSSGQLQLTSETTDISGKRYRIGKKNDGSEVLIFMWNL